MPGSATQRGRIFGTLTRAKRSAPSVPRRKTASEMLRLEMYGNGCAGSTASGVRTGKTLRWKYSARWARSSSVHLRHVQEELDAVPREFGGEVVEQAAVLVLHHAAHHLGDQPKLLFRGESVGGPLAVPGVHLAAETRHPHLEEFVEVAREDGQELEPLQQRRAGVLRLVQHAAVELQPRQLAVEVQPGVVEVRQGGSREGGGGGHGHRQSTPPATPREALSRTCNILRRNVLMPKRTPAPRSTSGPALSTSARTQGRARYGKAQMFAR